MDAAEILEMHVIEGITVYDRAGKDGRLRRYVAALAAKRPPSSRTVHLVQIIRDAGDGKPGPAPDAACGGPRHLVPVSSGVAAGDHLCASCLYALRHQADARPAADSRPAPELDPLREWKASVLVRPDGLAEVSLNGISDLLNAVIKDVPGRRWDREARVWLVPAAWVPDLAASLSNAGVEVRVTEQRAVLCTRCRQELALASGDAGTAA